MIGHENHCGKLRYVLVWLALNDSCVIQDNLAKRRYVLCNRCYKSKTDAKSVKSYISTLFGFMEVKEIFPISFPYKMGVSRKVYLERNGRPRGAR